MNKSIITVTLFMSYFSISNAANILAIYTLASPSVHIWNSPLVIALANRGHNVTVLSPEAVKKPIPNLTNLVIEDAYAAVSDGYSYEDMSDESIFYWIKETFTFLNTGCLYARDSNAFKQLQAYPPDTKFDLIIIEAIGVECMMGIFPKFGNPPIVAVHGLSIPPWVLEITGTPSSHVPYYYLPFSGRMNFMERVYNFIAHLYTHIIYNYDYLPSVDRDVKKFFGPETQSINEIMQNIGISMASFDPMLNSPWPMTPNLIPIAGIHLQDPKPLPSDLQKFLDEATEGAIFFSFGTNVRSDKLSLQKRKAILDAFAELPQRVLWKFESDLPDVPKNVRISKWLPQTDILAHPNIKLFITHSGLLSTQETIARAVPVVGIPFIVDQHTNIRKLVKQGCGVLLEYKHLTKETLLQAVHEVIGKSSYKENMKDLSSKFLDYPQHPLERAVYWSEYVIRHKGAAHLQYAAKDLNFIQYFHLDVIGFLLAIPALLIITLYYACRRKNKDHRKQKQN